MVVFCIGLGVLALVKLARDRVNPGFLDLFFLILLGAGYLLFNFNYSSVNLSKFKYVDQYSTAVLQSLPTNAVLLTYYSGAATDTVTFGLHYQQIIKHLRPDVTILTTSDIYPEAARNVVSAVFELKDPAKARYHLLNYVLKEPEYKNRPIYTTYIADDLTKKVAWTSVSNGLVYKFSLTLPVKFDETYHEVNPDQDLKILTSDMFGQDLLAQYKYAQAAFWAGQKDLAKTQSNFIEAIKYDYRVMGGDEKLFMFYRSRIFGKL